jgi:hypothetical protein
MTIAVCVFSSKNFKGVCELYTIKIKGINTPNETSWNFLASFFIFIPANLDTPFGARMVSESDLGLYFGL